jgi:hypothetical protein
MTNIATHMICLSMVLLLAGSSQASGGSISTPNLAEDLVKSQSCIGDDNVDAFLSRKSRHSQPDMGWRVFGTEEGGFDVERAFMVSKAMEIRYRWHVSDQGEIHPVNRRAEELCS